MIDLIVVGPTNSGKGTIGYVLSMYLGYKHISIGDLLRKRSQISDGIGVAINKSISSGSLVNTRIVLSLLQENISNSIKHGLNDKVGLVIDGFPRSEDQVLPVAKLLKKLNRKFKVIMLEIDKQTAIDRAKNRELCVDCGVTYNKKFMPTSTKNGVSYCSVCKSDRIIARDDDCEEIVSSRFDMQDSLMQGIENSFEFIGVKCCKMKNDGDLGNLYTKISNIIGTNRD